VPKVVAEAVETPTHHHLDHAAAGGIGHQAIEGESSILGT
jgi:hypothetical protein